MAKAKITKPSGTTILIEGSATEVADLVEKIEGTDGMNKHQSKSKRLQRTKETLPSLIMALIARGFFKEPKDLSAVKSRLDEMGHVYPVTTLSPALLRRVQSRDLRRLKQENRWFYTG